MLRDRQHAAEELLNRMPEIEKARPVVLAVPLGGVPIATELALSLRSDAGLVLVHRLIDPQHPSLTVGSIDVSGKVRFTHRGTRSSPKALAAESRFQRQALDRLAGMAGERARMHVRGRTVILVDDGAQTGATMIGAVHRLREQGAAHIVVALPVAPRKVVAVLSLLADQVVCLHEDRGPIDVRQAYESLPSLTTADMAQSFRTFDRKLARAVRDSLVPAEHSWKD